MIKTLKDLRNKSILVNSKEELDNVLMYMELSGVLWMNGKKPTRDSVPSVPVLLNLDSGGELTYTDYWYYRNALNVLASNDIGLVINYKDLKLNWYKLFKCSYNDDIYLYHIPTNQALSMDGLWKGTITYHPNFDILLTLNLIDNYKLTSSNDIELYQNCYNNTLSIKFTNRYIMVEISKRGFQVNYTDDNIYSTSSYMKEIDEVTFKKVN